MIRARQFAGTLTVALALALVGCSGEESSETKDRTPEETLELARAQLDETSGLSISLSSEGLSEDVTGLLSAEGVGTRAPAFEGSIKVRYGGFEPDIPVVAVDGKVFAQIPLTNGWSDIDPSEYGAPDPAGLLAPETGFSSLLSATTDVVEGDSVRGGSNNTEILTEFTGSVPDTAVKNVIPGASGTFEATYTVTESGELREAVLVGVFYADTDPMTYTLGFDDYGTEKDITAP